MAQRHAGVEDPVYTIKKHTHTHTHTHNTLSSTRCFIEYLVANEIIDQYRYA